jgi:hypothetical protein
MMAMMAMMEMMAMMRTTIIVEYSDEHACDAQSAFCLFLLILWLWIA